MIPPTFFSLMMKRKTYLYCVGMWFYFIYWKTLNRFKKMQNPNKVAGRKTSASASSCALSGPSAQKPLCRGGEAMQPLRVRLCSFSVRRWGRCSPSSPSQQSLTLGSPSLTTRASALHLTSHPAHSHPPYVFLLPLAILKLLKPIEKCKDRYG